MTRGAKTSWRLRGEVTVHRHGWLPLALVVALAANVAFQWAWLQPLKDQQDELQALLANPPKPLSAARPLPKPAPSEGLDEPLDQLRGVLAPPAEVSPAMASLFVAAEREGLRFERSSYQYEAPSGLPWTRVTIAVPVSGSYPAVRNLVQSVLRDHPNMSLDQLSIQREASQKPQADVELSFSAWFALPHGNASTGRGSP
ncbi:GspMb/PilO family protein [Ideonella sp. DXS29W]|uniref:GspMb/PilO family protein n=1 Tax=Ideonella lacteola TaxID=2984193 RepID=A0ABU9BNK3_9BURK